MKFKLKRMQSIQLSKKLLDLVEHDYVFANALFFLGIKFYQYKTETLEEVLALTGINLSQLNKKVEELHTEDFPGTDFFAFFEVDAVIEYLKHAHFLYIKEKIPYITRLIEDLEDTEKITHDLKLIFPYVMEDFIKHIYHEEDSLFYYVNKLLIASKEGFNESVMFEWMNKYSIQTMYKYHESDDEMKGIRELTDNYSIVGRTNTHLKVILKELQTFERDLFVHARIENEVLFPKALELESKVAKLVAESIKSF
jgi:regulator of cell morphogenesis and NO signaling